RDTIFLCDSAGQHNCKSATTTQRQFSNGFLWSDEQQLHGSNFDELNQLADIHEFYWLKFTILLQRFGSDEFQAEILSGDAVKKAASVSEGRLAFSGTRRRFCLIFWQER
ncbi:MAG TPA: hypothetical protein VGM58_07710, partial [Verrucomicrobiae bacterium]